MFWLLWLFRQVDRGHFIMWLNSCIVTMSDLSVLLWLDNLIHIVALMWDHLTFIKLLFVLLTLFSKCTISLVDLCCSLLSSFFATATTTSIHTQGKKTLISIIIILIVIVSISHVPKFLILFLTKPKAWLRCIENMADLKCTLYLYLAWPPHNTLTVMKLLRYTSVLL